jgi:hypothetical protein
MAMAGAWPVRTLGGLAGAAAEGPVPGEGVFGGPRWLLVWNRDPLGECCCWRGAARREEGGGRAVAGAGSCTNPGKHPWAVMVDGEPVGFTHGAADAMEAGELGDRYGPPGGARQLAVTLDGLLVIDVDGQRSARDFARLSHTLPRQKILGASTSPRGFHVWLEVPGWDQKALNQWLREWLAGCGGWDATDAGKAGRRGFLLDVRTGDNRYVVWPGADAAGQRRWMAPGELTGRVRRLRADLPGWRLVPPEAGPKAPWAVDTADPWLAGWIGENGGGAGEISLAGLEFTGSDGELEFTLAELAHWTARLAGMAPGAGRNNLLNAIAYFSGSRCVAAGHSVGTVRDRLIEVGESVGTHGVRATVDSGLNAGLAQLRKQTSAAG